LVLANTNKNPGACYYDELKLYGNNLFARREIDNDNLWYVIGDNGATEEYLIHEQGRDSMLNEFVSEPQSSKDGERVLLQVRKPDETVETFLHDKAFHHGWCARPVADDYDVETRVMPDGTEYEEVRPLWNKYDLVQLTSDGDQEGQTTEAGLYGIYSYTSENPGLFKFEIVHPVNGKKVAGTTGTTSFRLDEYLPTELGDYFNGLEVLIDDEWLPAELHKGKLRINEWAWAQYKQQHKKSHK
jgi:hypothetical protein